MGRENHPLLLWRRQHDLGGTEAATMLGISRGYLSALENRKKEPTLALAASIRIKTGLAVRCEDFLKVPFEELLKSSPDRK